MPVPLRTPFAQGPFAKRNNVQWRTVEGAPPDLVLDAVEALGDILTVWNAAVRSPSLSCSSSSFFVRELLERA
jgi:hypothetical protein